MTLQTGSLTAGRFLLAADTSGPTGSLALAELSGGRIQSVAEISWNKKAMHSELATVKLAELLQREGKQLGDVTHLAINPGPGSFTGIRVGLNMMRALAYSFDRPVASFNTLALLAAREAQAGDRVFVAIKAIQNFYYVAGFMFTADTFTETLAPCSLSESELNFKATGHTKVLIEGTTAGFSPLTDARTLAERVVQFQKTVHFFSWQTAKPLYIRASEAEEKMRRGILKPV